LNLGLEAAELGISGVSGLRRQTPRIFPGGNLGLGSAERSPSMRGMSALWLDLVIVGIYFAIIIGGNVSDFALGGR
jgi:hypothetical protein